MKNSTPVAVASRSFSRHPILRAELLERYDNVLFNDEGLSLSGESLIEFLRGRAKAITALERLDDAFFSALPDLRVIGKYGVGLDMIDLEAMQSHGVLLGWRPGVNRRSVAEMVISAAISLLHLMPSSNTEVRAGQWRQMVGRQLSGRTVGIIGCGHIGKDVALLLEPFGCRVLAHDICDYAEFYASHGVEPVTLDELLEACDVVTLHLPLNESTRNILDATRISAMRPGAILINMARGGLLDETAAKRALMDGTLGGAAFDVFEKEPPRDAELIALPNVIATSHIGGSSEEAILAMGRAAIDGLDTAVLPFDIPGLRPLTTA